MDNQPNNPLEEIVNFISNFFENSEQLNFEDSKNEKQNPPIRTKNRNYGELNAFFVDLTSLAEEGLLSPVIGRDIEINRIIQILNRKTKNNPVLIGDSGVGKTAIVEGLAQKIVNGQVPQKLLHKRILTLDIAALTAGTIYRGMFEERIKKVIDFISKHNELILFIDELHTVMGAGSTIDNNMDAANILKPHLTRGNLQLIGSTTLDEYRHIEKDPAFERRMQKVTIEAPSVEMTKKILKGLQSSFEKHHDVLFSDEALNACVILADRYLYEKQMPDKAIDLMDEIGSRINLKKKTTSSNVDGDKLFELKELEKLENEAVNNEHWELAWEYKLRRIEILAEQFELKKQNTYVISVEDIEQVVEEITGIPVHHLNAQEKKGLLDLETRLSEKVIGQKVPLEKVVKAVKRKRVNLSGEKKPIVLFFAGPTGVGKTELAKQLAVELFGDERSMIRFDMSEYMEKHSVSKLIGAPPGYVGHEKPGKLTEQVRRKPYSVVLLDEFEKAEHDVQHLFLQVFDDGRLTDSQGKTVDFSNTIIIMTSNIGSDMKKTTGFNQESMSNRYVSAIQHYFRPEFINRLDAIIPFEILTKDNVLQIADLQLNELSKHLGERNIDFSITNEAKDWLATKGYSETYGARPLKRVITNELEDKVTDVLLMNEKIKKISVDLENDELNVSII